MFMCRHFAFVCANPKTYILLSGSKEFDRGALFRTKDGISSHKAVVLMWSLLAVLLSEFPR